MDNAGYKAKRSPTLKKVRGPLLFHDSRRSSFSQYIFDGILQMAVVKQGAETAADAPRYAIACTSPSGYDNQPTVLVRHVKSRFSFPLVFERFLSVIIGGG